MSGRLPNTWGLKWTRSTRSPGCGSFLASRLVGRCGSMSKRWSASLNSTRSKPLTERRSLEVSIHRKSDGLFEIRWREGGRNRSLRVHGSHELAKKILRKKMSVRDENRHLDVKREVNFRMSALIDRYWTHYGIRKRSADREKSIVEGIRDEMGSSFVREVDG